MKSLLINFKKIPFFIKVIFLIAIVLRIYTITLPGFQTDVIDWQIWAQRLIQIGPKNFYSPNFFADYLPFFYILLLAISEPFSLFFGFSAIHSNNFILYFKLINNLFDVLTAFVIFLIVRKHNKSFSFIAPALYLINPGVIFNTSVWGQTDSIPTFFLVYAIYLLNEKGKILDSAISALLSLLIKPLILPLIPIMLIKTYLTFTFKKILLALFATGLLGLMIFFLFFPSNPILGISQQFISSLSTYPYTSINAFNFWALIGFWKSDGIIFLGLTYKLWGYIIFGIILLTCFLVFLRNRSKDDLGYYLFYTISSFDFFLFLTRIHERHIFPVFALLLISAFIYKSKTLIISYLFLSIIFLTNLFYSYYYYGFVYLQKHTIFDRLFYFISNYKSVFSLLNLSLFFIILVYYLNKQLIWGKDEKIKLSSKKIR